MTDAEEVLKKSNLYSDPYIYFRLFKKKCFSLNLNSVPLLDILLALCILQPNHVHLFTHDCLSFNHHIACTLYNIFHENRRNSDGSDFSF